jgi:spermidine/putrescine transport system substrate-binding protein
VTADPWLESIRGRFAGETLRVTCWSGPYATQFEEVFVPQFEEVTGAEVEVIPSWIEIPSEIKAAPVDDPPYDATIGDGSVYWTVVDDKLFLPIRRENVPNLDQLYPAVMDARPVTDGYAVPFDGAYAAIINAPGAKATKWSDWWSPEYRGALSLDVNYYYSIYAGIFALGYEPREALTDRQKLDAVYKKMAALRPNIREWYEDGDQLMGLFQRGELKSAYYYEDQLVSEESQDLGLTGVIPSDGKVGYIDYYFVVRGTRHRDLAEAWINYLISARKQQEWMIAHWASVVNENAKLPPETPPEKAALLATSNEEWAAWHDYDWDIFDQDWDYYADRWEKEVLGR